MKTASGLILWFLKSNKVLAVTAPWSIVYCTPGSENDVTLLAHETVHLKQIEQEGPIVWTIKVFWYLLRYGYYNSPYEVEAKQISGRS